MGEGTGKVGGSTGEVGGGTGEVGKGTGKESGGTGELDPGCASKGEGKTPGSCEALDTSGVKPPSRKETSSWFISFWEPTIAK